MYPTDDDVWLHHRVFEPKRLLSIPAALDQNVTAFTGREPAQMLVKMGNAFSFLHDGAVRFNNIIRGEKPFVIGLSQRAG
jgi:hypothetical protein